jgi:proteasome lid subunit RPN8/RPN11
MRQRIEADPALEPVVIAAAVLNEVFAHAREAEPEECCGLITGDGRERHRRVVRCRNDMTLHHQRDPQSYPRDGREGFYMNEHDYLRAEDEAEARGEVVTCVYHSHVGCGAWFSEMDQEFAEQPLFPFPEADHLVVSVVGGQVKDQALFQPREAGTVASEPRLPGFVGRAVVHGR